MARGPKKGSSKGKERRAGKSAPRSARAPRRAKKAVTKNASRSVAKPARRRAFSTDSAKAEVARLSRDLNEALARQAATSEVLKAISRSAFDLTSVLQTLVKSAAQLCEADKAVITRQIGEIFYRTEAFGFSTEYINHVRNIPVVPERASASGRVLLERRAIHIPDVKADAEFSYSEAQRLGGFRAVLAVPIFREGIPIGVLSLARSEARAFDDKQIELVSTFADQAAIAIENARLFNETKEALERQTATADILKVIARSPDDVQPVFQSIADQSNRLLNGLSTAVYRLADGMFHLMSFTPVSPAADADLKARFPISATGVVWGEPVTRGESFRVIDVENEPVQQRIREIARMRGWRSALYVPLLSDKKPIGAISVTRVEPGSFADHHVELLRTFADQAVIAIQNARLFNETKEALARQTATAEVLQVISSSTGDLKPVFEAMLAKAMDLCEADCGFIYQLETGTMRAVAEIGVPPAFAEYRRRHLHTGGAGTPADLMRATRKPAHVHDARDSEPYRQGNPNAVAGVDLGGARTVLYVPMIKDDDLVGVINLYRQEVKPFSDQQIALLESFASQAVIAIENARLFNETKEALERQTATADILAVIASSPDDVQPVFEAIAEHANRLIGGHATSVVRIVGDVLELVAHTYLSEEVDGALRAAFPVPITGLPQYEMILRGEVAEVTDTEAGEYADYSSLRKIARTAGFRSRLMVPLKTEMGAIGAIAVTRVEPGQFADRHVQLLKTFADQAVIAIQNVRLFNETKEALARQTATADVLKVIASSPSNLQPVFDAIAERSKALIGAHSTTVVRHIDGVVELASFTPVSPEADAALQALFPMRPSTDPQFAQILRGEVALIADAESEIQNVAMKDTARMRGWRSRLLVPLKDDTGVIGWISITRTEPGGFGDQDIELLQTFADQAVIAISNVELFQAVQDRTRELSQSLDNLRAAQDRLVQTEKLASLGQLTAGIAHEIKNPLNFINNFSALSGELIEELDTALAPVTLDERTRGDIGELTAMLKSNLEKVVQHGKRADSIVKNMLLHSREGKSERRGADINALVEESLNLAYHGARAERSDFQITLERDLDPDAGSIELYPQEITRALLNMISNGFYAATRRAKDAGNSFEPMLHAATRGHSDRVEIRIRDNGTGIPPDVMERMFNPFFTTKPPGEGTGLGLSMTHDIVVKQHGGTIDVATEPGSFTEFLIILPRAK